MEQDDPQPNHNMQPPGFAFSVFIDDGNNTRQFQGGAEQFRNLFGNGLFNPPGMRPPQQRQQASQPSQPQPPMPPHSFAFGGHPFMPFANAQVFAFGPDAQGGQQQQPPGDLRGLLSNLFTGMGAGNVNFGDYVWGPMSQIISQLSDPNRHGPPPVAKDVLAKLPLITVTESMIIDDEAVTECAVCKDSFVAQEKVIELPCKHLYHKECIMPWLEMHNTCPVCRYEMKTDNEWYENLREARDEERRRQAEEAPRPPSSSSVDEAQLQRGAEAVLRGETTSAPQP